MKSDRVQTLAGRRRTTVFVIFSALVMTVLAIKSFNDNWFEPQTPLELNDQSALVFFTLGRGCECQMLVIRNAEKQLAAWPLAQEDSISILRVDYGRRPDLAKQYGVARAPALVLLNAAGEVVWEQDVGLSDTTPLNLIQAQNQVETLLLSDTK
jgi:uncharacterized SAM-binding protein YcdF (DUF218 family)